MHLQSTHTIHLQHIESEAHLESSRSLVDLFCRNSERIKAVGYFRRRAPSWMFDRVLNSTLPSNYLPLCKNGNIPQKVWPNFLECLRTYSLECEYLPTFPRMFDDLPRNVWGHSPECLMTFPRMLDDIFWNTWQHSPEFSNITRNVWGHLPECLAAFPKMFVDIFPGMFGNIPWNIWWYSSQCLMTFLGLFGDIL